MDLGYFWARGEETEIDRKCILKKFKDGYREWRFGWDCENGIWCLVWGGEDGDFDIDVYRK